MERSSRTGEGWFWFPVAGLQWQSGHLHSPPRSGGRTDLASWAEPTESFQPEAPLMACMDQGVSCVLQTAGVCWGRDEIQRPGFSRQCWLVVSTAWSCLQAGSPWGWDRKGCGTQSTAESAGVCCVLNSGMVLYAQELPCVPWVGQTSNLGAGSLQA